jgi:hypothetical protein
MMTIFSKSDCCEQIQVSDDSLVMTHGIAIALARLDAFNIHLRVPYDETIDPSSPSF